MTVVFYITASDFAMFYEGKVVDLKQKVQMSSIEIRADIGEVEITVQGNANKVQKRT